MNEFEGGQYEEEQRHIDADFCRIVAAERASGRLHELDRYGYERPEYTPIGLDPLSSARAYEMTAAMCGPESKEAQEMYQVLRSDVRTALFEALIERGHISTTYSKWDEQEQGFKVGNLLYRDLLERAFDSRLITAEHERRQVEYHEELFIEELYRNGFLRGKALLTISPYPDNMTEKWAKDLGYKPSTQKYMMRWVEVQDDGTRVTKQLSMSGSNVSVLNTFLREQGFIEDANLSATEILNTPVLIEPDQFTHIAQVAQRIDALTGPDIFLGGKPNGDRYETLEQVSLCREARLASVIDQMAYELLCAEHAISTGEVHGSLAAEMYGAILLKTRNQICRIDPEIARESIGEKAYNKYKEAQRMVARGESEIDVDMCVAEAERDSEDIVVCGMTVDANGNESGAPCAEIRNGQFGQCPGCKHTVSIIVEGANKDKLYCPRAKCSLSKAGSKQKVQKKPTPKTTATKQSKTQLVGV